MDTAHSPLTGDGLMHRIRDFELDMMTAGVHVGVALGPYPATCPTCGHLWPCPAVAVEPEQT